jgi:ABC-type transporter Mla subunit MlaD
LYAEYQPHIRSTVIGDATIDFEFDFKHKRLPADAPRVPDDFVFNGVADESAFDAIAKFSDLKQDIAEATHSLNQAGQEVGKLAQNLNRTFGDDNQEGRINHLVQTTDRAMNKFADTMTAFNEIFGDVPQQTTRTRVNYGSQPGFTQPPRTTRPAAQTQPPVQSQPSTQPQPQVTPQLPDGAQDIPNGPEMRMRLRQSLNELPDAVQELRATLHEFQVVLQSAEKNFKNLEGFTEPLGQKGPELAGAMLKAVSGLDQLVVDLNALTQSLNSRTGTIGRLLHDDQVYENLNRLMFNFNKVLADVDDLAFRLKPAVDNARIFLDKVATEPGRIITGGLNPSTVK